MISKGTLQSIKRKFQYHDRGGTIAFTNLEMPYEPFKSSFVRDESEKFSNVEQALWFPLVFEKSPATNLANPHKREEEASTPTRNHTTSSEGHESPNEITSRLPVSRGKNTHSKQERERQRRGDSLSYRTRIGLIKTSVEEDSQPRERGSARAIGEEAAKKKRLVKASRGGEKPRRANRPDDRVWGHGWAVAGLVSDQS